MMKFFKQINTDQALSASQVTCTVTEDCEYSVRYAARVMRRHLETKHSDNEAVSMFLHRYREAEDRKRERGSSAQRTLPIQFGTTVSSITLADKERLSFLVAKTIVCDGLPFNAFYRTALGQLVRTLVPAFNIPSPPTLANKYIPMVGDAVMKAVRGVLDRAEHFTITTDGWKRRHGAMALNCVIVCCPEPVFVGVYRAAGPQTAEALQLMLEEALNWDVLREHKHKLAGIVTDNGGGIRSAREQFANASKVFNFRCCAHGLNLLARDLFKEPPMNAFLTRARDLVAVLQSTASIQELQRRNSVLPEGECDTRWNGTLRMLRRLHRLKEVVVDMADAEFDFTRYEAISTIRDARFWAQLERLGKVLEPLLKWQNLTQADSTSLADLYHHFHVGYGKEMLNMARENDVYLPGLHQAVKDVVEKRELDVCPFLATAAYLLHPKYAGVAHATFTDALAYENARDRVARTYFPGNAGAAFAQLTELADAASGGERLIFAQEHLESMHVARWWKKEGSTFPLLQPIAARLLSMPVNAAACERLWSALGRVYRYQRQRLTVKSLNDAMFPMWNAKLFLGTEGGRLVDTQPAKRHRGGGGNASGAADEEVVVVEEPVGTGAAAGAMDGAGGSLLPPAAVVEGEVPFPDVTEEADAARALADRLVGDIAE